MRFIIKFEKFGKIEYFHAGPEPTERWGWATEPGYGTKFASEAEAQAVVDEMEQLWGRYPEGSAFNIVPY